MAKPETPKSAATLRAEQKADKARIDLLRKLIQDEKKARSQLSFLDRARDAHSKKIREYEAELRTLKSKKYG
jgi:putative ubiquitin-RnfH superfamily antitoxin RatB of RatAB toxin-antitoxin module